MMQRMQLLNFFRNKVTLLTGKMGRGKTTNAVYFAKWIAYLFGVPVVQVMTNIGLTPEFGPVTRISIKQFLEQLILLDEISTEIEEQDITDGKEMDAYLMFCKQHRGLILYNCVILVDEFQKLVLSRRPNDRVGLNVNEFITQARHYKCTIIGTTPNLRNLDRMVRDQISWICVPDYNPRTHWFNLRFQGEDGQIGFETYAPDIWPLFNSWTPAGFRVKHIEKALAQDV
jgi:hypothetical protein